MQDLKAGDSGIKQDHGRPPLKTERVTGPKHVFAALLYSLGGIRRLWSETAFRHEVLLAVLVLSGLFALGASAQNLVIAGILALLLIAVEALNTAIEILVDNASPDWSEFARDAKDLGSLAVFCLLLANGLYLIFTVYPLIFPTP
jgi:diacylglycerol kinase (ATP)